MRLALLVSIFFSLASLASETAHDCEKAHESSREYNTVFDKTHGFMSRGILNLTNTVDSLIGDDKAIDKNRTSTGRIGLTNTLTDGAGFDTQAQISLQIRLPRTESRLKIVVDNISDQTRNDEVEPTQLEKAKNETEDNGLAAALKYLFDFGDQWESDTNIGIRIAIPLDPFTSFRIHRKFDVAKWKLGFTQTVFWFSSRGLGEVTRGDIDFPLPDNFLLRFANSASYLKNEGFFRINNSLTLVQPIGGDRALSYAVGASSDNQNAHEVQNYSAAVSYRQKILRKWIFMDIIPGFSWNRGNDFQAVASIALRFESVFGAID